MTAHTHDDAFHEIQLNGKQLVFLVMAATVVSVAIFLCGVLVGRNVRAERSALVQAAEAAAAPTADLIPPPVASTPSTPAEADLRSIPPPPTVDDAADGKRTDDASEVLKPAAPRAEVEVDVPTPVATAPVKASSKQDKAVATEGRATASAAASTTTSAPATEASAGNGFAVQVAALNVRDEADAIAKRLSSKGYAAYVQSPTRGTAAVYRVRVGTFKTRREAESIAARLQKEERFKPWVTR